MYTDARHADGKRAQSGPGKLVYKEASLLPEPHLNLKPTNLTMLDGTRQLGGPMTRQRPLGRLRRTAQSRMPLAHPRIPFQRPISQSHDDIAVFEFPTSQIPHTQYDTPNLSMQAPIQEALGAADSDEMATAGLSSTQPARVRFSFQDQLAMSNDEEPLER